MEHVVFYPSAEGLPSFRRVGSLDEAVTFVEHLRNVEGISEFSVQSLTPVPLEFRAYYRVEVPPASTGEETFVWNGGTADFASPAAADHDEDRSAEWVAAADVVEAPVADIPAGTVAAQPSTSPAMADLFAVPGAATATAQEAPFADAPPVTAPQPVAEADVLPEPAAVSPPSGRRSMGFFGR